MLESYNGVDTWVPSDPLDIEYAEPMVDDRENLDPEDKKEDSFEFDSAGEAIGYISMYSKAGCGSWLLTIIR